MTLPLAPLLLAAVMTSPPPAQPPECEPETHPTHFVGPELPRRPHTMHSEFNGTVVLAFDILPSGEVHAPTIVSASWQPAGRTRGAPEGYEAAILSAIAQWRYPPRPAACRKTQPLEFAHE